MKKHTLTGTKRTEVGRKVKKIRKSGLIPATIYGKSIKSASISVQHDTFAKLYEETGETGLIELTVGDTMHPVLVHSLQVNPVTREMLHIEFHRVDLKEKVKANIAIISKGEAKAVAEKAGVFLQVLQEVEVEALPTQLPEHIEVDVTPLEKINDQITVADIHVPAGVTILTDKSISVFRIASIIVEKIEEVKPAEAVPGEEGEVPTAEEGEKKPEDTEAKTPGTDAEKSK